VTARTARLTEPIAPAKLGSSFRWLFASSLVSNVGDGIALAAGPLLIASQTSDAFLVSMAVMAQVLPPLLFGFVAGAIADRMDRKRIVIVVNLARALVLGVLAATVAANAVNIAIVLLSLFALASAETFADVAAGSLLPRVVPREHLGTANARLQGTFLLANQLVAPPIGAFLFVIGMALPFGADAVCFALGAVLITRVVVTREAEPETAAPRTSLRSEMADGFRWLLAHAPMRTLALTIFAFNVTFGAAFGVLVLYARDRLGMDAVGFGLLTTATAIGGLLGTAAYGRLERRFALGDIMRAGLLIETVTHLVLALTTVPAIALVTMVVFGAHGFVWATTATTIRQRAVPDALLGRVTGVYTVGIYGGIVIGTPIGGLLARELGITAPFWFAFVGSLLLLVVLWRQLSHIAHAGAVEPEPAPRTRTLDAAAEGA
jgi:predicted MFS family arabinose efflux permease